MLILFYFIDSSFHAFDRAQCGPFHLHLVRIKKTSGDALIYFNISHNSACRRLGSYLGDGSHVQFDVGRFPAGKLVPVHLPANISRPAAKPHVYPQHAAVVAVHAVRKAETLPSVAIVNVAAFKYQPARTSHSLQYGNSRHSEQGRILKRYFEGSRLTFACNYFLSRSFPPDIISDTRQIGVMGFVAGLTRREG